VTASAAFNYPSKLKTEAAQEQLLHRVPPVYRLDTEPLRRFDAAARELLGKLAAYESTHPAGSTTLLNRGHHEVYFAETPRGQQGEVLRRHGDQMEALPGGYWRALGRADDTMNLGGIKISAAEIERVLQSVPQVTEAAAIAVSPGGGPSRLVIYAVCSAGRTLGKAELMAAMQNAIRRDLNPLFKIHDLVPVEALPRTPTNKVMRRALREQYLAHQ